MILLVVVLWAATLGSGFSGLEVEGLPAPSGQIRFELSVLLTGSDGPVIAHFVGPTGAREQLALAPAENGRWSATTVLREANWVLVLEDVGSAQLSGEIDFTTLGLLRAAGPAADVASSGGPPWGWLSLACLAGAVSVLLFRWSGRRRPRHLRPRWRR